METKKLATSVRQRKFSLQQIKKCIEILKPDAKQLTEDELRS